MNVTAAAAAAAAKIVFPAFGNILVLV